VDLYSITRSLWRHKFVTLPLLLLTCAACFGIVAVKAPTYTTSSTYILAPPKTAATSTQGAGNPFLNYGGLSIVAQELTTMISTQEAQAALSSQGATGSYSVAPSPLFGNLTPLIQINVLATSPAAALDTANLVGKALVAKMNEMQAAQSVAPPNRIKTLLVTAPSTPTLKVSGKLRDLIAVLALGIMLIFVAVSIMNALDERALRRRESQSSGDAFETENGHPSPPRTEARTTIQLAGRPRTASQRAEGPSAEAGSAHRPTESSKPPRMATKRRLFS
jgi:capsular polysaccharide biosynthesis protein